MTISQTSEVAGTNLIDNAELLSKQVYIDEGCVIFSIAGHYDLPLAQLNTPIKVLEAVIDLSQKSWITTELIGRFILLACDFHKIALFNGSLLMKD